MRPSLTGDCGSGSRSALYGGPLFCCVQSPRRDLGSTPLGSCQHLRPCWIHSSSCMGARPRSFVCVRPVRDSPQQPVRILVHRASLREFPRFRGWAIFSAGVPRCTRGEPLHFNAC
ncbi:hypothetical protein NDU88_002213 [Pleurodeles waltl]|uniref:Integron gene cassette protein n=1 Tax=Pleurodeles waltl TaxID=8319 RepID=A0AAV7U964_PLEWA|nr:hypothetical protein NDU88_002213 [Pleurodeles waltl]